MPIRMTLTTEELAAALGEAQLRGTASLKVPRQSSSGAISSSDQTWSAAPAAIAGVRG